MREGIVAAWWLGGEVFCDFDVRVEGRLDRDIDGFERPLRRVGWMDI